MSNDFCALPTDFPLTLYGQKIFREVIRRIDGDDVLDLGCGTVGHYWAMGYMQRVKSITYADYCEENIDLLSTTLARLTPDFLQFHYEDTIQFLQAEQLLSPTVTYEAIAEQLITTCAHTMVADFKQDLSFLGTFDTVLALESIECVDTQEEFFHVVSTIYRLLKPNGTFVGIITPYDSKNAYTQMFIDRGVEGNLNPQRADVEATFQQAQFEHITVQTLATGIYNYSQALVIHATKGASSS